MVRKEAVVFKVDSHKLFTRIAKWVTNIALNLKDGILPTQTCG